MSEDHEHERTIGGFEPNGRLWVIGLFALGGTALGILLPIFARWASELPWMPFQGPLQLLGSFDEAWLVWGRPILGALVGVGLALWVILDSPVLVITPDQIQVQRRGATERIIAREKVAAVYLRGAKTIIETDTGRAMFDDEIEGDRATVRSAFVHQGYPWEGAAE